ncbi:MAG: heme o synthase [Candidatus Nucleicultricaceae bacterium]
MSTVLSTKIKPIEADFAPDSSRADPLDFITLLKPGVMTLVVYSAFTGACLAPNTTHPFLFFVIILSIALGSGGSAALNMWYDRDIDRFMTRTRHRPIPAKKIAPHDALSFGIVLSLIATFLLSVTANFYASLLLLFSIFFYAVVYTIWLKRLTPQNIVIGGAAGAFPPVIGWLAITPTLTFEPLILFLIIFFWTPYHFWALAYYRHDDYERVNVPMYPNVYGYTKTRVQILIYALLTIVSTALPPLCGYAGGFYTICSLLISLTLLYYVIQLIRQKDHKSARALFKFSLLHLFAIFTCLLVDKLLEG